MVLCCVTDSGGSKYYDMDFSELTKIIFSRLQKLEPDDALKIMGCILLKGPGEQEMLELALGHENKFLSTIKNAKAILSMLFLENSAIPGGISQQFSTFSSPDSFHISVPLLYWTGASDPRMDHTFLSQPQFLGLGMGMNDNANLMGSYCYSDAALGGGGGGGGGMTSRTGRRSQSLLELPRTCHYYIKGFCKHGVNCRYSHGPSFADGYSQLFSLGMNELPNEDHGFTPASLEKLEMEIIELLRSKRGSPVSIASLPMLYYEKYGRNLQAEGYLTESQRHGKTGFSLTKLLARLKNSIRLIDRPHGQHSVILTEDAHRYMECMNERNDPGATAASSHQIYLTFPADSTFTEGDVANYFSRYGPVRDVRIPSQDKRMFGFVSFIYAQTVHDILMKRNPHFICNSRVLVKPYREKSRIIDGTNMEKIKPAMCCSSLYAEMEAELHAIPRESDCSRMLQSKLIDQVKVLELERSLPELNLASKHLPKLPHLSYDMEKFEFPEVPLESPLMDRFSYTLDALNNSSTSDDKARLTSNSYTDQESGQIELPESPFASPTIGRGISTVI